MEKLCPCQDKDTYHDLCSALESCVHVDEDYKSLLLFIEKSGVGYAGERDNPKLAFFDVDVDPLYMNFLANTKLDGTSYVSKVNDQNGLTVFIKYERDRELEFHGVERGQDHVREKCELGRISKALKTNARKNRMGNGILSKKQRNEDRDLDNRKQRIDVEIVPGKEHKMKGGILSKKPRNEDMELANRKQQIDVNIGPGKEQQVKDGILSKRQGNEDRDLDNRNHRIDVMTVHGKKQKMNDGILSKERQDEDRDLFNCKHIIDENIIPVKELKIQNDSKFMDVEVKIEPHEDSDSIKEAESKSEVEILENVGAEIGWGSSSNPFVPSVERCLNLDATIIDSRYRKEVLNLLMKPYNEEEYKKLWKDIKMRLPSSSTNGHGKSLLSLHKAVNRAIKRANHDKDKKLNIMRGFFFWLEHLTRQDAFQPWEDAECLQTMPGSS